MKLCKRASLVISFTGLCLLTILSLRLSQKAISSTVTDIEPILLLPFLNLNTTSHLIGTTFPAPSSSFHPLVDSCLVKANRLLDSDRALEERIPIFSYVTIAPSHDGGPKNATFYWITFCTKELTEEKPLESYAIKARWHCHYGDESNETMLVGYALGKGCPHGHTLTVRCPYTEDLKHRPLYAVTATPKGSETKGLHYNVTEHTKCALLEHDEEQNRRATKPHRLTSARNDSSPDLKIAACLFFRGALARKMLKQFIAYHRLQGYDRFFVYFHDEYNHMTMSHEIPVEQPDVKYIPADIYEPEVYTKHNFLGQQAAEVDCLHRCRAMGADFAALHDVDEFIQMRRPNTTLKEFLHHYMNHKGAGVVVHTVTWDLNSSPNSTSWLLDNIIRDSRPRISDRWKIFDKPNKVWYHSVHTITKASSPINYQYGKGLHSIKTSPFKDIRFNHYRNVSNVPFQGRAIKDTSMYLAYRDIVVDMVNKMK
jgi:hypothetical protein